MSLHRLTSLTLGVPSVAASTEFFRDFGLTESAPGVLATRDGGDQLHLTESPRRKLQRLGLGVHDADDLGRIAARLEAFGVPSTVAGGALTTHEPVTGLPIEVTVAAPLGAAAPAAPAVNRPSDPSDRVNRPADVVLRDAPVAPSNLTHLVYGTPDQPTTLRFFTEGLGFEISDEVPGIIAFTRCGEVHHNLALQAAPVAFVHHIAFEVDDVDEVVRGGSAMIERDPDRQLWGVGRHAIGSNWFWYLREPGGTFVEYTADIDRITSQDLYVPKEWGGREFLYSFGPAIPAEFLEPRDMAELLAAG